MARLNADLENWIPGDLRLLGQELEGEWTTTMEILVSPRRGTMDNT
jgi:hypothetical protein